MSGSGGSGTPGDWIPRTPKDGGPGEGINCEALVVDTALNSPVAAALKGLKKGELLSVELSKSTGGRDILVARTQDGAVAGSLTPPQMIVIIGCIKGGTSYVAELLDNTSGGHCSVRIRSGAL